MAQRRKSKNAITGPIIGFLLAGTVLFAFWNSSNQSPDGVLANAKIWSDKIQVWMKEQTAGIDYEFPDGPTGVTPPADGGTAGNPPPATGSPADPSSTNTQLASIAVAAPASIDYNRDEWRHWDNVTPCWNVRDEVLNRQAQPGSLTYLDADKNVTSNKASACSISGGTWVDPYTGKTFTNPADLDIDHMVPLGYAARHGGQAWDENRKRDYANSQADGHLLAVFASANRQKSDKGPSEWKPQASYQCQYAKNWISVTSTWGLSVTQADKDALGAMLATC